MPLKVKMLPHLSWFETGESGIHSVVRAYFKYLPDYDIELVRPEAKRYDLLAVHAGSLDTDPPKDKPVVNHLHGLYWSADHDASKYEYEANRRIVNILRYAKEITVPSAWVAETIQRDLRVNPHVVGHGVDWQDWQHNREPRGYVLAYAKNRSYTDVCDPSFIIDLARQFPSVKFLCTFAPKDAPDNVINLGGTIPHSEMRRVIQESLVVISPIKETFGLLTLESMAAGKPVLGVKAGGNVDLIQHGVSGYLYTDDIAEGLNYCLKHGKQLGDNGRELARAYTWQRVCEQVAGIYQKAMEVEPPTVSVVIPVYNKPIEQVVRAIDSCRSQTLVPSEIIVINDGSDPQLTEEYNQLASTYHSAKLWLSLKFIHQANQGVAIARNNGIAHTTSKYICCLDSDDWIEPTFLETCVKALETDPSLALAYTGLTSHEPNGKVELSPGNPYWNYDRDIDGQNTVWTCNVFRRSMWERLGGYKSRYCPFGAGEEDGELWLRMGAYGLKAEKVTNEGLFHYSWKTGFVTGNREHKKVDYRAWHPWILDRHHPLASYATPINKVSHPVRQYDQPIVSVIIPVGPGHERVVIDALDSLESQSFRKWEAIIVSDIFDKADPHGWIDRLKVAYPYIRDSFTGGGKGAGFARNWGVSMARAPLILFLDADDTLRPIDALEKMVDHWNTYEAAIYTDYVGQAHIDEEAARELQQQGRLESYNHKTGEAIIAYPRGEYDYNRAIKQPTTLDDAYNWNVVTTLLPKVWHFEIGGFDEQMDTLEDWDYWLRLAKAGKCFKRLPEKLVRYRLRAGERHIELDTDKGRQKAQSVLEYIRRKHEDLEIMPCGCKSDKNGSTTTILEAVSSGMADGDFVRAMYLGGHGNHHIIGAYQFSNPPTLPHRKKDNGFVIYYGYADHGFETLVHKQDVRLMPGKWQVKAEVVRPVEIKADTPPPAPIEAPLDKLARLRDEARVKTEAALARPVAEEPPAKSKTRRK